VDVTAATATTRPSTPLRRRPSGEPPPLPRTLNRAAVGWAAAFGFWAAIWIWIFLSDDPAIWITERDLDLMAPIIDLRGDSLTPAMRAINRVGTHWATPVVGWTTMIGALAARRVRQALVLIAALSVVAGAVTLVSIEIARPRPLGVTQLGEWEGFAQPSRPVALLAAALVAGALTLLPAGRRRVWYRASAVALAVFGFAQIYTGVDHPSDVIVGATVGIAITLVLFRMIAPEIVFPIRGRAHSTAHLDVTGARGDAIRQGLRRQLGIEATEAVPIALESSAGSTPLRIDTADGRRYFAKLYASNHLRSDRWYKLGRTLLYGRLEDEQRFTSVRRLAEHEDYMLHVMHRVGLPSLEPFGVVEITPDREYLVVTEFLADAVEIGHSELTDAVIDSALEAVHLMWCAGLAHRDIKPANVMVYGDQVRLVDVSFGEVRPSPWRQAVDLANMMLVLALRSSPERVFERARLRFSDDEIAEAFAAARGVTLPSQLRRDLRRDGRALHAAFVAMVPPRPPVAIQRWSVRRVGLMLWTAMLVVAVASVFLSNLEDIGLR
jgi:tRNA A-37 threonylcarbamoyl transferase component Bud32/membrane-associated phospholipid phosphatase